MAADRSGPRPWFGCDTTGEAWRAYCEAWSHVFQRKGAHARGLIESHRGKEGLAILDHNIAIVKDDYRGAIDDRAELPRLLRLAPTIRTPQKPAQRR